MLTFLLPYGKNKEKQGDKESEEHSEKQWDQELHYLAIIILVQWEIYTITECVQIQSVTVLDASTNAHITNWVRLLRASHCFAEQTQITEDGSHAVLMMLKQNERHE